MNSVAHWRILLLCTLLMAQPVLATADTPLPPTDGLVQRSIAGFDQAWLSPELSMAEHPQVIVDPVKVGFDASWISRYNRDKRAIGQQLDQSELDRIAARMAAEFDPAFSDSLQRRLDSQSGSGQPEIRIVPRLLELELSHVDLPSAARTEVWVARAGSAMLVLEFHRVSDDRLLGWAMDRRETRENRPFRRANRAFNQAEFRLLFQSWASSTGKLLMTANQKG